jgi:hypothetical protein
MANLGDRVKDRISGFTGIVTGKAHYLYGCTQCSIKPQGLHNGAPIDADWFDEPQLEVLEENALAPAEEDAGGPARNTPRGHKRPPT